MQKVTLTLEVDPVDLFMSPQHAIQRFSLMLLREQQNLMCSVKGMQWSNSTTSGKVVECSPRSLVVLTTENKREELALTGPRLRQLLAATTSRK